MNKPVTIDLDDLAARAQPFVDSGQFPTIEHVLDAGLEALEKLDISSDGKRRIAWLREKIAEADADPRPLVSMEDAFARVRAAADARR